MPKDALERLLPDIEQVKLVAGDVLNNVDGGLQYAYFPIDVIVTVLVLTAGRETMNVAVIGRGGMTGVPILMGNASPHRRLVVLNNGDAFKIPIAALKIVAWPVVGLHGKRLSHGLSYDICCQTSGHKTACHRRASSFLGPGQG